VLVSDTVGFVRKLPHQLVQAFRSTLEVVAESDLLIHVVDATATDPEAQIDAVRRVLNEIDADHVPELLVINKADASPDGAKRLSVRHPEAVVMSAFTGEGTDELLVAAGEQLRATANVVELLVPFERGDIVATVHREGEVMSEAHEDGGTRLRARLDPAGVARVRDFLVQ
jgi:GTP-binding protein HflX